MKPGLSCHMKQRQKRQKRHCKTITRSVHSHVSPLYNIFSAECYEKRSASPRSKAGTNQVHGDAGSQQLHDTCPRPLSFIFASAPRAAGVYLLPKNSIIRRPRLKVNRAFASIDFTRQPSSAAAAADYQVSFKRLHREPTFTPVVNTFLWHPLREEVDHDRYTDTTTQTAAMQYVFNCRR